MVKTIVKTSDMASFLEALLIEKGFDADAEWLIQENNDEIKVSLADEDTELEQWIIHFTTKYDETLQKLATS